MSTGDGRRGRRDNGLIAAEYAAAGDVDPRVGEHLLDVLGLEGIAAYLRPSTDLHPVTRATSLPDRPTDRLYVDRIHLATARAHLHRLVSDADEEPAAAVPVPPSTGAPAPAGASTSEPDLDTAWAQIIAGYSDEAPEPVRPGTAPPTRVEPVIERSDTRPVPRAGVEEGSLLDGLDTFGAHLPDDDDEVEDYTPPPAPPVPRPSLPTVLAVLGIVGGLVVFLSPDLLPVAEGVAMLLGFAGIAGGFFTLVWRLRPGGDDDEPYDPDQGAKV